MPLSLSEAENAPGDISNAEHANSATYGYRRASPHLILWGVIWTIGHCVTYVRPQYGFIWPGLVLSGIIVTFGTGWNSRPTKSARFDWRYGATLLAIMFFVAAVFAIMQPQTSTQVSAFFPVLVALFYCLVGIWTRGMRMLIAGIVIAALAMGGYFWLQQYFLLGMAAVGGGALILGGVWLRSA